MALASETSSPPAPLLPAAFTHSLQSHFISIIINHLHFLSHFWFAGVLGTSIGIHAQVAVGHDVPLFPWYRIQIAKYLCALSITPTNPARSTYFSADSRLNSTLETSNEMQFCSWYTKLLVVHSPASDTSASVPPGGVEGWRAVSWSQQQHTMRTL